MTPKELKEKTDKELQQLKNDLMEELFQLKIKKSTGQLEKTHRLRLIKKDIARILTLEKQKGAQSSQAA